MNDTIWQQIAATSWWMIVACGLIAYFSYLTTKPKIISLKQLALSVILFIITSIIAIYFFAEFNMTTIPWLSLMMMSGIICGWLYYWRLNITCRHDEPTLMVPGSWLNFLILISTSVIIYLNNIRIPTDPYTLIAGGYAASIITGYGFATGFVIGRFFYGMYLIRKTAPAH